MEQGKLCAKASQDITGVEFRSFPKALAAVADNGVVVVAGSRTMLSIEMETTLADDLWWRVCRRFCLTSEGVCG